MRAFGASLGCVWVVACGYLAVLGMLIQPAEAGCTDRANPKCCTGRNNECFEFTRRKAVCFCDTYCQKTGDCCADYQAVCQISVQNVSAGELRTECCKAIDCVVGSWGPWSECSSLCGGGSKERTRQVTVPPRNGGTPCPDLKQRRGCFGHSPVCNAAEEVAKILPDSYKRNFKDPWRRPHMLMKEVKPSYCVHFRVKQASTACRLGLWSSPLLRERSVCIECQGEAMGNRSRCEGDGLEATRTFWTAASVPGCQGSWVRESSREQCTCPQHSLIFV
ncbi:somatomedin-B and thrombospondin type-1 domain-containing protein-like isoform X1 [Acipenser oxyrinchus oxyrinchus]|uniref:Somatomedin-B and thrombospondin type-1 domain-containing protein-like isoform X1 n=1 Tax=Acipenser oxyrinchus oxyrinchus TaxID=40147 RepID=A0AAD8FWN4_ACIOX|nr:somatomedin-B and thrombospondin type-1 domain-containing protein-like isoform X1 [Acipenser oxyrinchus oxyrinchus]